MRIGLHWRLVLGFAVGAAAFTAAVFLHVPRPERALIGWNVGSVAYLISMGHLFLTSDESQVRRRSALQDERRGVILGLVLLAVAASLAAIVAALITARSGPYARWVAALAVLTLITAWMTTQVLFTTHYAHRHFQAELKDGAGAGFRFPGDSPTSYQDFLYLAVCIGATAQISDPDVPRTSLRNLVTAHAAISFFYNTAVLALGINIIASVVGK